MAENTFIAFLAANQWILILAAAWIIPWKGVALWRAAKNRSVVWFVVLLIINTIGILDIIYIFAFSKRKDSTQPIEAQRTQKTEKIVLDVKTTEAEPKLDEQTPES